ncbi:MAG: patatin-like phospholipase family protein [Cellulosilyticaceae bacterium]
MQGLVLEGGGMRGSYTAGVLDLLLEKQVVFPYCVGVSAGACQGASYVSMQYERNLRINTTYAKDKRYISIGNLLKTGSLFGMEMLFDKIPNDLEPFDYETFAQSKTVFKVGTTDCNTGQAVYHTINDFRKEGYDTLKASSSLPLLAPIVHYEGMALLDGGIADPIPIGQSIADGNKKHVIVLTRHDGYEKKKTSILPLVKQRYKAYPALAEAMGKRHTRYNETLVTIRQLEAKGECFVIRPLQPLEVGRFENNPQKLRGLYEQGYREAAARYEALKQYLEA